MSKKTLCLLSIPLLLFLFLFPEKSFRASCDGVTLWFNTVLPSLLPFIILSGLLLQTGALDRLVRRPNPWCCRLLGLSPAGAWALLLGLLCGYPMGAKLTADLYASRRIDRPEADYLLSISSHASPMFLITFVVYGTLGSPSLLAPCLLVFYGSAALCALFFRVRFRRFGLLVSPYKNEVSAADSAGALLDTSIMNGFEIIVRLGGYIILFSLYGALLRTLLAPLPALQTLLAGLIEITTGITCISRSGLPFAAQLVLILTCTSFGGLSTLAQANCVLSESGLSLRTYLCGKLLHALFALLLSLLFLVCEGASVLLR